MSLTSNQKNIVLWGIVIILSIAIISILSSRHHPRAVTLQVWGPWDNPAVINPLLIKFHQQHPLISLHYLRQNSSHYNDLLVKAFASSKAPDIFIIPNSWLPLYQDKISFLNIQRDKTFSLNNLQRTYPDVILDALIRNNKYLAGIPLTLDTPALYYNKNIFDYYNIALPPSSWNDVLTLIPQLRKTSSDGSITQAAIALGTAHNTNWSTDILSSLIMQEGSSIINPQTYEVTLNKPISSSSGWYSPGEEALKFYTQFANSRSRYYTWNDSFQNSLISFAKGKVAMIIGYSRARDILKQLAPDLNYGIAPFPISNKNLSKSTNASIMTVVVNKHSADQQEAWEFLKFLARKDSAEFYFLQTKYPPARRDLIAKYLNDPQAGAFLSQSLSSKTWYQPDFKAIQLIFTNMIDSILRNNLAPSQVIYNASDRLKLLISQYNEK